MNWVGVKYYEKNKKAERWNKLVNLKRFKKIDVILDIKIKYKF